MRGKMKPLIIVIALLAIPGIAYAQQPPPDPQISAYSQLLAEANARLTATARQVAMLEAQNKQLQARVKELEDKYEPKDKKK